MHSNLHRSIVTIYVGPEQYPFYLHKGRLCQQSSFFEGAFHGSFEEATTRSIYLEEDGVEEFTVFEEWLYTYQLSDAKESADPSLLLVKLFCFAEKVGISTLQNATLDAIRDRAMPPKLQNAIRCPPLIPPSMFNPPTTSLNFKLLGAIYLPPATSTAIYYIYQNTLEGSPLRRLLADMFAFNVRPKILDEDLLVFPTPFVADVLTINMKRLPLRLPDERADFDISIEKYHVYDTGPERKSRMLRSKAYDEPNPETTVDSENDLGPESGAVKPSGGTANKKKGKRDR